VKKLSFVHQKKNKEIEVYLILTAINYFSSFITIFLVLQFIPSY